MLQKIDLPLLYGFFRKQEIEEPRTEYRPCARAQNARNQKSVSQAHV
jgi:hypothetical protein